MPAPWEQYQQPDQFPAPKVPSVTPGPWQRYQSYGGTVNLPPELEHPLSNIVPERNTVIDIGRGIIPPLGAAVATGGSLPTGPGAAAAGAGAFMGLDYLLNRLKTNPPSRSQAGTEAAQSLIVNEALAPVFRGAVNTARELYNPGAVVGDIYHLNPTFSQYYQNFFGPDATGGKVSQFIENMFASGSKSLAMEKSAKEARDIATGKASVQLGRRPLLTSPDQVTDVMYNNIADDLDTALTQYYNASGAEAGKAKNIALMNPKTTQIPVKAQPTGLVNAQGQPIMRPSFANETVNGPVDAIESRRIAQQTLNNINTSLAGAQPLEYQRRIMDVANQLLDKTSIRDPNTGQIIGSKPLGFEDAWLLKRLSDQFGYGTPRSGIIASAKAPTDTSDMFQDLGRAITYDIDHSLPNWQNGGNQAARAWSNAKALVAKRLENFAMNGDNLRTILENNHNELPMLDTTIKDPKMLQRALTAGEFTYTPPSGKPIQVSSTNLKQDMQGYWLSHLMDSAYTADPARAGFGKLDTNLINARWTDPEFQQSKQLLFNAQQRGDLDNFFKQVDITQSKYPSDSNWMKLRFTRDGALFASGFLLGGHITTGVAGIAGVEIPGHVLGRLMSNPKSARLMAAMVSGSPLNMSNEAAARVLTGIIGNAPLNVIRQDGSTQQMQIDNNQLIKYTPPEPKPLASSQVGLDQIPSLIDDAAAKAIPGDDLFNKLSHAVAKVESNTGQNAGTNAKNATGVFQLRPAAALEMGLAPNDRTDILKNVKAGTNYLAKLYKKNGGDIAATIADYNFGQGNVAKGRPLPPETTNYINKVLSMIE